MNSKQPGPQLRVATSQARVDAKDTGIATLGPVRIFNRAKDLQPLRRTPTLIEKMFPTVRFRHDLAKKEDAINSTLAMHRTETEMKFAMLEAKQRELERKLAEKDMIIAAQDGLMSSQSTEEIKTRLASAKAAENELQKKVKELEGTLQNKEMVMKSHDSILEMRDRQLKEKEGLLKQKDGQLDEQKKGFARTVGSITHDMNSPLMSIMGWVEMLEESGLDASRKMMVSQIYRGAKALKGLVEDILLYTKLENTTIQLKKEDYSLTEQMRQLVEGNRKYASASDREIIFKTSDDVQIHGDRARLERVFGNLLSNAIKYGKSKVVVSISRTADSVVVSIYDDGKDMDEEVKNKVFKGQEMVTTDLINGNGFGLTNSKRIVDMHGGSIRLESKAGKGKTFIVEIPVR